MMGPVLITGSRGRLGRALRRVAHEHTNLVALASGGTDLDARVDVADLDAVRAAVADVRPRAIIHLASMVGSACENEPSRAMDVNVGGTENLLVAAQEQGVSRMVFISTAAVYGDVRRRPLSEKDWTSPSGVYATSKLAAEELLLASHGAVNVDVLRVFNVYGPEMSDSLIVRLAAASRAAPVRLTGLDRFVRDYVHVDDVVRAILAAATSPFEGSRVLNVGSGVPTSNRDLLELLPAARRAAVDIGPEVESYSCADITRIVQQLPWRPTISWMSSMRAAVERERRHDDDTG